MATCSICENVESASVINELLEKGNSLDSIAQQTGHHRSSVFRHFQKCFPAWRAARLKARKGKSHGASGRLIVEWPPCGPNGPGFTCYGETIPASELRPDDVLFCVEYQTTDFSRIKNPRALAPTAENLEGLLALALAEDQERTKATPA